MEEIYTNSMNDPYYLKAETPYTQSNRVFSTSVSFTNNERTPHPPRDFAIDELFTDKDIRDSFGSNPPAGSRSSSI